MWQNAPALIIVIGSLLAAFSSWYFQSERHKRKRELFIFVGAAVSILGALWSSSEQTAYEQKIAELNQTMLSNVTGGDSYCYVKAGQVDIDPERYWALSIWQVGEEPCFDVAIQTKDVDAFREVKNKKITPHEVFATMPTQVIGTVPPKSISFVFRLIDLNGLSERKFSFLISARNGYVTQKLALKKVEGQWRKAIEGTVNLTHHSSKAIVETDPGFPRDSDGQVLW